MCSVNIGFDYLRLIFLAYAIVHAATVCLTPHALAQDSPATSSSTIPITISLPENVELRILVEYVSQQL